MPGLTDVGEVAVLNHQYGGTPLVFPSQLWMAWLVADPTDGGSQASEIGRTALTGGFSPASGGSADNLAVEPINTSGFSSDANPISHWALVYTASAGTYYWTDSLLAPVDFTIGEILEMPANGFKFNLDSVASLPQFEWADNARNKMLDHLLGTTQWTLSGSVVQRLHTDDPTQTGLANEFSGPSYSPQPFAFTGTDTVGNASRIRNNALIQFLDNQDTPYHSHTLHRGSDFLSVRFLSAPKTVPPGSTIDFPQNRVEVLVA